MLNSQRYVDQRKTLRETQEENDDLKKTLKDLEAKNAKLEAELEKSRNNHLTYCPTMDANEDLKKVVNDLETKNLDLERQYRSLLTVRFQLMEDLKTSSETISTLTTRCSSLSKTLKGVSNDKLILEQENANLKKDKNHLQDQCSSLEESLKKPIEKAEALYENMIQDSLKLNQELTYFLKTFETLQDESCPTLGESLKKISTAKLEFEIVLAEKSDLSHTLEDAIEVIERHEIKLQTMSDKHKQDETESEKLTDQKITIQKPLESKEPLFKKSWESYIRHS
jgi:DNA repair exonuclease SbcCD ATPase subunit